MVLMFSVWCVVVGLTMPMARADLARVPLPIVQRPWTSR